MAGWEHCIAFYIVLMLEVYFSSTEILVSYFTLFNALKTTDSLGTVSSETQPR